MSGRVSLSRKAAKTLADYFDGAKASGHLAPVSWRETDAVAEIRRALAPRKPKTLRTERLKEKRGKRLTKNEQTAAIRNRVVERCAIGIGGDGRTWVRCEACGANVASDVAHMDHYFGKAKRPQSVSNCWLLCANCDHAKTHGRPSSSYWHGLFAAHCDRYGYRREAADARAKFEAEALVLKAAEVSRG